MNMGSIGACDFKDPAIKEEMERKIKELPMLKGKEPTTDNLEAIMMAYRKKYRIQMQLVWCEDDCYVGSLEEGIDQPKRLTGLYAMTFRELMIKIVLYCYNYTRRKYGY